jgi:RNA polymerase sigma-70 factor (ECF subfamily)
MRQLGAAGVERHGPVAKDPDRIALKRIAAGEVDAIGELYDRHASLLLGVALRILRGRADAEDVVHDAFVVVADRAARYERERGAVRAWLVTVVRNLSIERVRRGALPAGGRDGSPMSVAGERAGERERILRALASLPEVERGTLESAFFGGLTYTEIAARDGVPVGMVESRAARGVVTLREALAREGVGTP